MSFYFSFGVLLFLFFCKPFWFSTSFRDFRSARSNSRRIGPIRNFKNICMHPIFLLLRQLVYYAERKMRKLLLVSTIILLATVTTRASSVFIETLQVMCCRPPTHSRFSFWAIWAGRSINPWRQIRARQRAAFRETPTLRFGLACQSY